MTGELSAPSPWQIALLAAQLLLVDASLGGIVVRAAPGPVRQRWLDQVRDAAAALNLSWRKIPVSITADRLHGGIDFAATLAAGKPVHHAGVLTAAAGGILLLAMAERLPLALATEITARMDGTDDLSIIALDEGLAPDEKVPPALNDRLAFPLDLDAVAWRDVEAGAFDIPAIRRAREQFSRVIIDPELLDALCDTAAILGILSSRPVILATRAARAAAALAGRSEVDIADVTLATRLVLAPRALRVPELQSPPPEPTEQEEHDPNPEADHNQNNDAQNGDRPDQADLDAPERSATTPTDRLVEAARAALPAGLLAMLGHDQSIRRSGSDSGRVGAWQKNSARGRSSGVRSGVPRDGARLNLIETLRAAAPWQRLRPPPSAAMKLAIRRDDLRVNRRQQRSATVTIFVLDASGSAAAARLAEAKGAVELLLADCYIRRDQVAVIMFRGTQAELILPPTRSLVRAKRSLAGVPGGGGTPLAMAIEAAYALADLVRRKGATPLLVFLTDGRGNIARNGQPDRAAAEQETQRAARRIRAARFSALIIDTSPRPAAKTAALATDMGARYQKLPYLNSQTLAAAVQQSSKLGPRD